MCTRLRFSFHLIENLIFPQSIRFIASKPIGMRLYECCVRVWRSHDSEIIYKQIGFKFEWNSFHPQRRKKSDEEYRRKKNVNNQSEVVVGVVGLAHSIFSFSHSG